MRVIMEQSWTRSETIRTHLDLAVDCSASSTHFNDAMGTEPTMRRNPRPRLAGLIPTAAKILPETENDR